MSERIRLKEVTPVQVIASCLARIQNLDPDLNAFITVLTESALADAEIATREILDGHWRGPLHGIPIALKDFFDTSGTRTTAGSEFFKDRVPTQDAEVVQRLKAAGAVIIGKTNMHELGMGTTSVESFFGSVKNPWNTNYAAGGSSGGSAVAVAAGMCYATVDTDAVGSCRLPAAVCGVTGFKGTFGLISGNGILAGEEADPTLLKFVHVGVTARTAKDVALVVNTLADQSAQVSTNDYTTAFSPNAKSLVLGVTRNSLAINDVTQVVDQCEKHFAAMGFKMVDVIVPFDKAVFSIAHIDEDRRNAAELFQGVDVFVSPTTIALTPTITMATQLGPQAISPANTFFANYFGLPAITIPCGFDKNGLPLGLQIIGKPWAEVSVLQVAYAFQKVTKWHSLPFTASSEYSS